MAVSGLEGIMDGLTGDTSKLIEHLKTALGGMHTAFYTTLFGAVLGGIFLKLLLNFSRSLSAALVEDILTTASIYLVSRLKKSPEEMIVDYSKAAI